MHRLLFALLVLLAGCPSADPDPQPTPAPDADGDGYSADVDCDDDNPEAYPGAAEVCDGVDSNCDGEDDALLEITFFADADADGFGVQDHTERACQVPSGFSRDAGDCDDTNPAVNPDADEVCNELDDDCDGLVDGPGSVDAVESAVDGDGDGYGHQTATALTCGTPLADSSDCDDTNPASYPGATELCDALDNDCDGGVDLDGWIPVDYPDVVTAIATAPAGAALCVQAGDWAVSEQTRSTALTLRGAWRTTTFFDAGDSWMLSASAAVTLASLTVKNTSCNGVQASVVDAAGPLVVTDVTVDGAQCDLDDVGGIFETDGAPMTLGDVDITGFTADIDGTSYGVLYAYDGELSLTDVVITDALIEATSLYGTLYAEGAPVMMDGVLLVNSTLTVGNTLWGILFTQESSSDAHVFTDIGVRNTVVNVGRTLYGALALDDLSGATTVDRFVFANNLVGIGFGAFPSAGSRGLLGYSDGGSVRFTNLRVTDNTFSNPLTGQVHGLFDAGDDLAIINADIANNTFGEVLEWAGIFASEGFFELVNTTFANNSWSANSNMADLAQVSGPATDATIEYVNVVASGAGESFVSNADSAPITAVSLTLDDPQYTDEGAGDYSLSAGSPLIDAGDPSILDFDGTTSDLGAYGGPGGATWLP